MSEPNGAPSLLEEPRHTLDALVIPAAARAQIDAAMVRIGHHDTLYREWGLQTVDPRGSGVALNLYGPPGTGKTLCAEGVAGSLNRPFLRIGYADLESKFTGDTAKNLVGAFRTAKTAGAVLFFDEADAVLSRRIAQVGQSADHALNLTRSVLLVELERFDGVVIFATNLIVSYDPAFLRRMFAHIRFELPDRECRERLWKRLLPAPLPREGDVDTSWLADNSAGLSGGDMLGVLVRAACRAVQRLGKEQRLSRHDIALEIASARETRQLVPNAESDSPPSGEGASARC